MKSIYDNHYRQQDLFGKPYPQLVQLMQHQHCGTLLDIGSGQGRNALALARLGFSVHALESSRVGLAQISQQATKQNTNIVLLHIDCYKFDRFSSFQYILADNFFHFYKKDLEKETQLVCSIFQKARTGCTFVFCISDIRNKSVLLKHLATKMSSKLRYEISFQHRFPRYDQKNCCGLRSIETVVDTVATKMKILVWEKI